MQSGRLNAVSNGNGSHGGMSAMEAAAAAGEALGNGQALPMAGAPKAKRIELDEEVSPTAGRRFTRA